MFTSDYITNRNEQLNTIKDIIERFCEYNDKDTIDKDSCDDLIKILNSKKGFGIFIDYLISKVNDCKNDKYYVSKLESMCSQYKKLLDDMSYKIKLEINESVSLFGSGLLCSTLMQFERLYKNDLLREINEKNQVIYIARLLDELKVNLNTQFFYINFECDRQFGGFMNNHSTTNLIAKLVPYSKRLVDCEDVDLWTCDYDTLCHIVNNSISYYENYIKHLKYSNDFEKVCNNLYNGLEKCSNTIKEYKENIEYAKMLEDKVKKGISKYADIFKAIKALDDLTVRNEQIDKLIVEFIDIMKTDESYFYATDMNYQSVLRLFELYDKIKKTTENNEEYVKLAENIRVYTVIYLEAVYKAKEELYRHMNSEIIFSFEIFNIMKVIKSYG